MYIYTCIHTYTPIHTHSYVYMQISQKSSRYESPMKNNCRADFLRIFEDIEINGSGRTLLLTTGEGGGGGNSLGSWERAIEKEAQTLESRTTAHKTRRGVCVREIFYF